ncbi:tyrosine-type recombinase/integrase [Peptostreptococcus russellii]|uniref:tyrosine-type recombinase/integrase n=2 Tax=Peptostreptococcus russellii TaxID=215200 RepID=UPI0026F359A2|nr:site-specific integrase [Peptostreptococcus russellii]
MGKRANGESSISKFKFDDSGKCILWRARIMFGYNENGKPIRKQFYGKTQKDVREKLEAYKQEMLLNTYNADYNNITFQDYFYKWLFGRKDQYKPTSFQRYESIYRIYLKDSPVGKMKLKDLKQQHLNKYYKFLMSNGVSNNRIIRINQILKTGLNGAIKDDIIVKNPASLVQLPKYTKPKIKQVLTQKEQYLFCKFIEGHELEALYYTALCTGMRLGEILGLKWERVDITNKKITVSENVQSSYIFDNQGNKKRMLITQSPKTDNVIRIIPIPDILVTKLKAAKISQLENKLLYLQSYIDNNLVFTDKMGKIINNKRPNKTLKSILKELNIEPIKFHGLRKTYATRLFEKGVSPKTVQVLIGHADIAITLNLYTEVMEEQKEEAIDKLNEIFDM